MCDSRSCKSFFRRLLLGGLSLLVLLVGGTGCKATPSPSPTQAVSPLRPVSSPLQPTTSAAAVYVTPTPGKYVDNERIDPRVYPIIIAELQVYGEHEIVTLANISDRTLDIGKWGIYNPDTNKVFPFPATLPIGPGEAIRVHSGKGASAPPGSKTDFFWTDYRIWGPSSDPVDIVLVDGAGARRFVRRMMTTK